MYLGQIWCTSVRRLSTLSSQITRPKPVIHFTLQRTRLLCPSQRNTSIPVLSCNNNLWRTLHISSIWLYKSELPTKMKEPNFKNKKGKSSWTVDAADVCIHLLLLLAMVTLVVTTFEKYNPNTPTYVFNKAMEKITNNIQVKNAFDGQFWVHGELTYDLRLRNFKYEMYERGDFEYMKLELYVENPQMNLGKGLAEVEVRKKPNNESGWDWVYIGIKTDFDPENPIVLIDNRSAADKMLVKNYGSDLKAAFMDIPAPPK